MKKVAIVGGGISGITAALELSQQPGVSVRLFDSAERLGGVLETVRTDRYLIERSADNFATLIPDARLLSDRFGLLPQLIHPNTQGRQAFVYLNGRVHPIPEGFSLMQPTRIGSIITTRLLTWPGKLRLLGEYWVSPRPTVPDGQPDDESLESFAVRRLGREVFDRLVEPIVGGIFTADPKTLSMAATLPQFLNMERTSGGLIRGYLRSKQEDAAAAARRASGARYEQFMAPRDGMSAWIDGLAKHLPANSVSLNCRVVGLARERQAGDSSWMITTDQGSPQPFDGVILATPASVTARLLQSVAPEAAAMVSEIPYASSAVVAMIVNRADIGARMDGFGVVVPSNQGRAALAISYSSNKYPGRTPEGEVLLRVFLGGALRPEVVDWSDTDLQRTAVNEVRDILAWKGSQPNWQAVIRWKNAMPQYLVGHVAKIQRLRQQLDGLPSLQLCGAAYEGVGIPQCVRGAKQAVERLCHSWKLGEDN